ncbi:hypothetical protein AUW17_02660 [Tenacibaculum dicentrarchi]|nr:hypothetical protein AUW17_02660 [Tenacibaculum dicentrarchi]
MLLMLKNNRISIFLESYWLCVSDRAVCLSSFLFFFKQKKRVAKARPLGNAQNISGKIPNKKRAFTTM